jgi:hypothetical protein
VTLEAARLAHPMKTLGHAHWAIAGGHIPLASNGREPEFTSHDRICILNTSAEEARVEMMILYADCDPIGPYRLPVAARRVRHVRFNDLIDPLAMPLDTDYSVVVTSSVPVVVQFSRQDTGSAQRALLGTLAF